MLGFGIGAVVRNTGGAVTGTVLALFIAPPIIAQIATEAGSWVPASLANVVSGVATDVGVISAVLGLIVWALAPAAVGFIAVERRDVV